MINLPRLADLQRLIATLQDAPSRVLQLGDLASRDGPLAVSLDGVAAESHRLNADAMDTLEAIGSWLGRAAEGLLRMDPGEIGGLVDGGGIILSDLQRLLAELEQLARKA